MAQLEEYLNLDFQALEVPKYLTASDQSNFQKALNQLNEIKKLLDKGAIIGQNVPIPAKLQSELDGVLKEFTDHIKDLSKDVSSQSTQQVADYYRQQMERVNNYYNAVFTVSSSNNRLNILNTINTFGNELAKGLDEKVTGLINRLEDKDSKAGDLIKELESKAKENVISDYAQIFKTQETKNRNSSRAWLIAAVVLSIGFVYVLIISIRDEWLKFTTTLTFTENNIQSTQEVFNFPLLISKFLIISFVIYFITFCFKQYSINKHLQIVNQQRKNAINSYKLFEASLEKNDSTKNILMLELAKAIYELTHSGFISKSTEHSGNQVVEWTKMIENK